MSRFPTVPALEPAARLPALLALLLVLGIVAQLMLGAGEVPVPDVVGVARVARGPVPAVPAVTVPPVLATRNLFLPPPLPGSAPATAPEATLPGGAQVAGAIAVRGRRLALVTYADGHAAYVAAGGHIGGWRLVAIAPDGVRLRQGARTITMAFGARTPEAPPPPESAGEDESDPQ